MQLHVCCNAPQTGHTPEGQLNINGNVLCAKLMYRCTGKAKKAVSQSMECCKST